MKRFLMFCLLFSFASAAQAQDQPSQEPAAPVAQEDVGQPAAVQDAAPETDDTPAPVVDLKTRSATAAAIDAATLRAPADADMMDQGIDTPRNFWWLVAAIVLGGIILAILL